MKRAALLALIIILLVAGYLYGEGLLPFTPVSGSVLESTLQTFYQDIATIILLSIAVVLLTFLIYSREIFKRRQHVGEAGDDGKDRHVELALSRRFEFTERALREFAHAMETYAEHMASHTSAIQGLSQASQALKGSAAQQNRILGHLSESIIRDRTNREIAMMERLVSRFEEKTTEALQARDVLEGGGTEYVIDEIRVKKEVEAPPGCVVNPKALNTRPHTS